ncbi:hypothetical protein CI102_8315 [Trichoderma harzianum]|nr:hypothetical protein CI102_8315 [Trichoderma harzianum]
MQKRKVGSDGTQKGAAAVAFRRPLLSLCVACICVLTSSSRGGDEENRSKRMLREEDGWSPRAAAQLIGQPWPSLSSLSSVWKVPPRRKVVLQEGTSAVTCTFSFLLFSLFFYLIFVISLVISPSSCTLTHISSDFKFIILSASTSVHYPLFPAQST